MQSSLNIIKKIFFFIAKCIKIKKLCALPYYFQHVDKNKKGKIIKIKKKSKSIKGKNK